jgi:hypothetical protein
MISFDPFDQRARFFNLVDDVCRALDQPVPVLDAEDVMSVLFCFDEVRFELSHDMTCNADVMLLECEFGSPPESEEALKGLMQANLNLLRAAQGSFGLRRVGDLSTVTFGRYLPLGDHSLDIQVRAAIQAMVGHVRLWQTGAFF